MAGVEKPGEIWRCDACSNVVEVRKTGGGQLFCCGAPMLPVKTDRVRPPDRTHPWR